MKEWKGTKGECFLKDGTVSCNGGIIAIIGTVRKIDEERNEGESWLDMRQRTRPEREALMEERRLNGELITDAFNTMNKCGIMPSELLEQRNELLEALQKIVEMNYQTAQDKYGDRNTAKTWACVVVAEKAISKCTGK